MTRLTKLCINDGKIEDMKEVLDESPDAAKMKDDRHRTALFYYCEHGSSTEVLRWLIEKNPAAARDREAHGHSHSSERQTTTTRRRTATKTTRRATTTSSAVSCSYLNLQGRTPLHYLCDNKKLGHSVHRDGNMLKVLVEACPDAAQALAKLPKENGIEEATPLHILCEKSYATAPMVRALLQCCPDAAFAKITIPVTGIGLNQVYAKHGDTSLHILCRKPEITVEMLQCVVDVSPMAAMEQQRGDTPLHVLCERGDVTAEMVSCLVEACPPAAGERVRNAFAAETTFPLHHQ